MIKYYLNVNAFTLFHVTCLSSVFLTFFKILLQIQTYLGHYWFYLCNIEILKYFLYNKYCQPLKTNVSVLILVLCARSVHINQHINRSTRFGSMNKSISKYVPDNSQYAIVKKMFDNLQHMQYMCNIKLAVTMVYAESAKH